MSDHILQFEQGRRVASVFLPFRLERRLDEWAVVRRAMLRGPASGFTRDEWAYLVGFLDASVLNRPFEHAFGLRSSASSGIGALYRPRGGLAIWLPNNASLLGPLVVVMASLAGVPVRGKSGSRADDLASAFVDFCRRSLPECELRRYFETDVEISQFGRDDPRNVEMSRWAASRMVFGSDEAAQAVCALPHRPECRTFAFGDHRSEAWLDPALMGDAETLILGRVFAIYGRAGCTSPSRVVLVGGTIDDARELCLRLLAMWDRVMPQPPGANIASECVMAQQFARASGGSGGAWLASRNSALLIADEMGGAPVPGMNVLPIVSGSIDEALASMPTNIQTVGYVLPGTLVEEARIRIASTLIKRMVPLAQMHHFGPVWDGYSFWKDLFEEVELG
jgi:hypothetical protein